MPRYSLVEWPEEEIIPLEVEHKDLYLFPWFRMGQNKQLSLIDGDFRGKSTILKWSWTFPDINNIIKNLGFSNVFCVSHSENIKINQIPFPYYVKPSILSAEKKDIAFSFVGWNNNAIRNTIFKKYSGNSVIQRDSFFKNYQGTRMLDYEQEYIDILSRSRFSLCPRGIGSGSFRFWESLRAGAIPVLISNEYRLPTMVNWEEAIVRIDENKFINNPNRIWMEIESISKEKENKMRQKCLEIDNLFSSGKFLNQYVHARLR